jgi:hypothetical protein
MFILESLNEIHDRADRTACLECGDEPIGEYEDFQIN